MKRRAGAADLLLLLLLEKRMDGQVVRIDGRVRQRPVAKIHAVLRLIIAGKSGRQIGGDDVVECNAVGCSKAAVDGNAHDGGSLRAHVNGESNNVTSSPFAAVTG